MTSLAVRLKCCESRWWPGTRLVYVVCQTHHQNQMLLNVLLQAHQYVTLGLTGSMRMIDEDEVGLKEKPEDTRYIKKITSK